MLNVLNFGEADACSKLGFDGDTTVFLMLLRALAMKKSFELNVDKMIVYSNVSLLKHMIMVYLQINVKCVS